MNKLAARMKEVWENIKPRSAHLGLSGEKEMMFARYKELISNNLKVNGKTIIDFGCGGALLGLYLLENFKPLKYIGFDLAERSIQTAQKNLLGYDCELKLLKEHRFNFAELNPDIIVCLACIIHFPTQLYLDNFLKDCNLSNAKNLVLEIRDIGNGTKFSSRPYENGEDIYRACLTDEKYVSEHLFNYFLTYKTEPSENGCQVLYYRKKSSKD